MHRNLDRRVEALVRIADPDQVSELIELMDESTDDGTSSWHLEQDGTWQRHHLRPGRTARGPAGRADLPAAAPAGHGTVSPTHAPVVVEAAGALVWRVRLGRLQVALVHRPRYDDWSWPKGKVDPGETILAAATREVAEETGHDVVLGIPLPGLEYALSDGRRKRVHYWAAQVAGRPDAAALRARPPVPPASPKEIDQLRWFDVVDGRQAADPRRRPGAAGRAGRGVRQGPAGHPRARRRPARHGPSALGLEGHGAGPAAHPRGPAAGPRARAGAVDVRRRARGHQRVGAVRQHDRALRGRRAGACRRCCRSSPRRSTRRHPRGWPPRCCSSWS